MILIRYNIKEYVLGILNTYAVVYNDVTKDEIIIDLGDLDDDLMSRVRLHEINVATVIAIYGHFDHVYGVYELKNIIDIEFVMHKDDEEFLNLNHVFCEIYGIEYHDVKPDRFIESDGVYRFGSVEFAVIHVPGRTPGSIAVYVKHLNTLLIVDTFFADSVSRTDLPGGSWEKLVQSICKIYEPYPSDTAILPEHRPSTTLRDEVYIQCFRG